MFKPGQDSRPLPHLHYLDAARGLAAMIVVVYHFINWQHSETGVVKIANFFFNGATAVDFFFVLSGFVLSYKYLVLRRNLDVGKFYLNRFFRLWPAFFITLVLIVLYLTWEHKNLQAQTLIDVFFYNEGGWWKEILLVRPVAYVYYVPGWTLCIELIMSLFVPFAIIIALNNKKGIWWLCVFLFLGAAGFFKAHAVFINHFTYGVLAATYFTAIQGEGCKKLFFYRCRYLLLPVGLILFSLRPIEKMWGLPGWFDTYLVRFAGYELYDFTGVGSLILLVYILQSTRLQRILNASVFRFIGKISYGLYLVHWLIVMMIFTHYERLISYFPNEKTAFPVLLLVYIAITVLLALVLYKVVELPFIKKGKKITSAMKPTLLIEVNKGEKTED